MSWEESLEATQVSTTQEIDNRMSVCAHQDEPPIQAFMILILIRNFALRKMTEFCLDVAFCYSFFM